MFSKDIEKLKSKFKEETEIICSAYVLAQGGSKITCIVHFPAGTSHLMFIHLELLAFTRICGSLYKSLSIFLFIRLITDEDLSLASLLFLEVYILPFYLKFSIFETC